MERITNVRISTLTKSVSHDGDVSIVSVGLNNGHVFAVDSEGNTHDMGAIIISNIEIVTPQVASGGCGCNTPNANVIAKLLRGVDGVDGITPDMSDYYDKITVDNKLKQKQDSIGDLATIREGAAKGATALQSVPSEYVTESELSAKGYATTSQVNAKQDVISDLDTIRSGAAKGATSLQPSDVDSEMSESSTNPIQNKVFSQAFMLLIEDVDLALQSKQNSIHDLQTIREGAAKGATALQEETYKGTVTAVKINGETKKPSDGIVDLGEISGGSADLAGYATEEYVDNAVAEVNAKGEDGYVYSNGEKVDMRFTRSLLPVGTSIPAKANLNTIAYLKVGKYYCSLNVDAETITNCPVNVAFAMEVFNPLGTNVDDEETKAYCYRIRILTEFNTGIQYIQYCNTGATAGAWTYASWYVTPRTSFSLNSSKNDGSAAKGAATRGVYIDSTGTFQQMTYTLSKSVPSNAVFTDTNTKVTSVGNHYVPAEDADAAINAPEGEVVVGLKRDAAGHIVGIETTPMTGGSGGGGGTITEAQIAAMGFTKNVGTITEVKMNGVSKGTSGVVELNDIASAKDLLTLAESIGEIDEALAEEFAKKQDTITDLDTIREGAAKGATSYSKPSGGIPKTDLASDVQAALVAAESYKGTVTNITINGSTKSPTNGEVDLGIIGTYSKPSTGIPKSDLASSVQTSLGKADTAVQPADIKDEVYIADFTMESLKNGIYNGTQVNCDMQTLITAMNANRVILVREDEASGFKGAYVLNGYVEDLLYFSIVDSFGNILWCDGTAHTDEYIDGRTLHLRDWYEKQDALVSGENIKTINGESILGSGNITAGSAQLPLNKVIFILDGHNLAIPSGKVTNLTLAQTRGCTFVLSTDSEKDDEDNVWIIRFAISIDNSGIYQVNAGEGYSIKWANGIAPTFENGKYYEMSFRLIGTTFLGVWASFE